MSTNAARLARVVTQLIAYRGWTSPEAFDQSYRPGKAPVGGATMRRIASAKYGNIDSEDGQLTLTRLSGMLRVPLMTLALVYRGDRAGIERLAFDDDALRQFVLDQMNEPSKRGARKGSS
jgi:hypothetical protein